MPAFSCFLIGSDTLLLECAEVLRSRNHSILGVITAADRLRKWAEQVGLQVIDPASDYEAALRTQPFDYLFSITYLERIPEPILALPRMGAINFHDGPLPRYAGLNVPAWALMNQEAQHGVCWHRMTSAIDQGAVLKRHSITLDPDETAVSLNTKCLVAGVESFERLVADIDSGSLVEETQDPGARSYFGKYRRPAAAAFLDWNRPARELDAMIRGLQFGTYPNPLGSPKVVLGNQTFIVTEAHVAPSKPAAASAGSILEIFDEFLLVATGDGAALELRGISDLRGRDIGFSQLALRQGSRVEVLSADKMGRLTELDKVACRAEAFWTERLAGLVPVAAPLGSSAEAGNGDLQPHRRRIQLPRELVAGDSAAVSALVTLAVIISRIERQTEFDLAVTDVDWSTRISGLENAFSDESCLRIRVAPESSFADLSRSIAAELEQLRKRGTWLHDLVARQQVLRTGPAIDGTGRLPVGVVLGAEPAIADVRPRALTLVCGPDAEAPVLVADAEQYSIGRLETLVGMLETLASGVVSQGQDCRLSELSLLDRESLQHLAHEGSQNDMAYPDSVCVHEQIEQQVRHTPDRTALSFGDIHLSYQALNERANQLAERLIKRGIGPEGLVGVHAARSIDMVVATLAVLKAGGAYVPLDPEFPAERLSYMIQDSGLTVVLSQKALQPAFGDTAVDVILIDDDGLANAAVPTGNLPCSAKAHNLAYVLYTSGSTGRPKGVMVEHRNVVNFFTAMDARIHHDPPGTWLGACAAETRRADRTYR